MHQQFSNGIARFPARPNIYSYNFYLSITQGLMNKAIEFPKTIVDIPDEDLSIIM